MTGKRFLLLPMILSSIAVAVALPAESSNVGQHEQGYEKIEWTWSDRPEKVDPRLPDVLLIGDSITRDYYPTVAQTLAGRANVYLFATSASLGDDRLPGQIAEYAKMIQRQFAVVHFNNGMHGWGYSNIAFTRSLPVLIAAIRRITPTAKLIWASITPIRKDGVNGASNMGIDARNTAAAAVVRRSGIVLDDQHRLMAGQDSLYRDDVHFLPAGSAIQGQQAATLIATLLPPSLKFKNLKQPGSS